MKLFLILILCSAGMITGCVSVSVSKLNAELKYPPVNSKDVVVYKSDRDVNFLYKQIAWLTASGSSNLTNDDSLIETIKQKAGELGANGIVLMGANFNKLANVNVDNTDSVNKINVTIVGTDAQRQNQAIAIRVDFSQRIIRVGWPFGE